MRVYIAEKLKAILINFSRIVGETWALKLLDILALYDFISFFFSLFVSIGERRILLFKVFLVMLTQFCQAVSEWVK